MLLEQRANLEIRGVVWVWVGSAMGYNPVESIFQSGYFLLVSVVGGLVVIPEELMDYVSFFKKKRNS